MNLKSLYRPSLAALTDLYQLTMAYGYWKLGMADHEACFHLFFRRHPFRGNYTVACGIQHAVEYIEDLRFGDEDLQYLAGLSGNDGQPLFDAGFLEHLRAMQPTLDVAGVLEGEVVFPHTPLLRVSGPLIACQLVETPLLNIVNFQTLIATKAARIARAAQGEPVLEFGLRRAQGIDGALAASRAAYVENCAATSNVLAGRLYDIPVKGTHAHSWVMAFDTETEAFEAYARAMPNNCVFLVDTYDTAEGVRRAVAVGRRLRERGYEMVGVRLDSGDLAELSIAAREILDEGGFPNAAIVASNDLDEYRIESLKGKGAKIGVWGVGTRLATAWDQPALGGVYKLAAIREPGAAWQPRVKLSENAIKVSNPGLQQVRRVNSGAGPSADVIFDATRTLGECCQLIRRESPDEAIELPSTVGRDLLVPLLQAGRRVWTPPPLREVRERAMAQAAMFAGLVDYPYGLEGSLHSLKTRLIAEAEGGAR